LRFLGMGTFEIAEPLCEGTGLTAVSTLFANNRRGAAASYVVKEAGTGKRVQLDYILGNHPAIQMVTDSKTRWLPTLLRHGRFYDHAMVDIRLRLSISRPQSAVKRDFRNMDDDQEKEYARLTEITAPTLTVEAKALLALTAEERTPAQTVQAQKVIDTHHDLMYRSAAQAYESTQETGRPSAKRTKLNQDRWAYSSITLEAYAERTRRLQAQSRRHAIQKLSPADARARRDELRVECNK
jgi:hypothetical protein